MERMRKWSRLLSGMWSDRHTKLEINLKDDTIQSQGDEHAKAYALIEKLQRTQQQCHLVKLIKN